MYGLRNCESIDHVPEAKRVRESKKEKQRQDKYTKKDRPTHTARLCCSQVTLTSTMSSGPGARDVSPLRCAVAGIKKCCAFQVDSCFCLLLSPLPPSGTNQDCPKRSPWLVKRRRQRLPPERSTSPFVAGARTDYGRHDTLRSSPLQRPEANDGESGGGAGGGSTTLHEARRPIPLLRHRRTLFSGSRMCSPR